MNAQLNSTILGVHRPGNGDTESPVVAGASGVWAPRWPGPYRVRMHPCPHPPVVIRAGGRGLA